MMYLKKHIAGRSASISYLCLRISWASDGGSSAFAVEFPPQVYSWILVACNQARLHEVVKKIGADRCCYNRLSKLQSQSLSLPFRVGRISYTEQVTAGMAKI